MQPAFDDGLSCVSERPLRGSREEDNLAAAVLDINFQRLKNKY